MDDITCKTYFILNSVLTEGNPLWTLDCPDLPDIDFVCHLAVNVKVMALHMHEEVKHGWQNVGPWSMTRSQHLINSRSTFCNRWKSFADD